MSTPSIPRCGRLDSHAPHTWTRQPLWWESPRTFPCLGVVVTEGGWVAQEDEAYRREMDENYYEGDPDA